MNYKLMHLPSYLTQTKHNGGTNTNVHTAPRWTTK